MRRNQAMRKTHIAAKTVRAVYLSHLSLLTLPCSEATTVAVGTLVVLLSVA